MPERLRLWSHRWPRALACALLPSSCALCGAAGMDVICRPCHQQYVAPRRTRCPCCANPVTEPALRCGSCLANQPAYDATIAAVDYAAPLDQLVLQLKFAGRLALAPWFAHMLRDGVLAQSGSQPGFTLPDLLCPVPLGPRRLVERGFNQALEIARPLSSALGIALRPRLAARTRDTRAQSGVTPGERDENICGAFAVAIESVRGRHIGVVDDVMTSGHTLAELAATLKRAGAARVSNLVFARTAPN